MARIRSIHLLVFGRFLAQMIIIGAKVESIIVFGDSTVDSGNNNYVPTVLKSNFKPYGRDFYDSQPTGRFCNGRIVTDFISEAYGIRDIVPAYLDPYYNISDFVKGVSFASAGTGFDNLTAAILSVIPLWKELEYFKEYKNKMILHLGVAKASKVINEALYLISIGTNDFLENYYSLPLRSALYSVEEYENFLLRIAKNFITDIHNLGARKILIAGLPPMGCLPLERTKNYLLGKICKHKYNRVARDYNVKLKKLIGNLKQELDGLRLVYSDVYSILSDIIANPRSFGFEVGERACCATGRFEMSYLCNKYNPFTCNDANAYVFWDSFHPSERTNFLVAQHTHNTSLQNLFT